MSEKTLNETIGEVIGETMTPQSSSNVETEQGISTTASDETQSGDTPEKEFVSGIDISDIPVQDRTRIRELLGKKAKSLEDGYNKKFQEVASYKKERDQLMQLGLTVEEAQQVLGQHVEKKRNPPTTSEKKDAMRTLDQLITSAPLDQRPALEQMRTIIHEETNSKTLNEKIDKMEKILSLVTTRETNSRRESLSKELDSLQGKYGKEFIDKYKDIVISEGVKYTDSTARGLLHAVSSPDELEQALLNSKKVQTKDKLNAISSSGAGVTSSKEQVNIKQNWGGLLRELAKK